MTQYAGGALHTESGGIYYGSAGDQGGEVTSHALSSNWTYILRPPKNGALMAYTMGAACRNQHIGYDQLGRTTGYNLIVAKGDPALVTTACEVDCSSLVAACCTVAGYSVPSSMWTGNEISLLKGQGFSCYYFRTGFLEPGDVLWRDGHTEIYLGTMRYPSKPIGGRKMISADFKFRFNRSVRVRTSPNAHSSDNLQGVSWSKGSVCDNAHGIVLADGCTWLVYVGHSTGKTLYAAMTQDGIELGEVV